jgi:1,4-alpha-glucan branching enzyme
MPASQDYVTAQTPMGATVIDQGTTFRVWAPRAQAVYVALGNTTGYQPRPNDELVRDPVSQCWTGFFPGVLDGTTYRYFVIGAGPNNRDLKRDPWARELEPGVALIDGDCIVREGDSYPWHDGDFRPPAFNDLIVYQLHVGVFYARDRHGHDIRPHRVAKLLDVLNRVEYLADLGVNAIQPLPLVEFHGEWSLGYNGTDIFSPETDYCVPPGELGPYLDSVNALLSTKGLPALTSGQLTGQVNQLKAFVDICHVYGIAVIIDVVYNHAGGGLDRHSLDYLDMPQYPDRGNSLYFSTRDWAGGKVFAFDRAEVRSFLIENGKMFLRDYHADGLRFDEVTVIDGTPGGWSMCQDMTATLRYEKPSAALIAEYWGQYRWLAVQRAPHGMGFDLGYSDVLRDAVRGILAQAAGGADATVDLNPLRAGLHRPWNTPSAWQAYNCIENHDLVLDASDHRSPRIPVLAGGDQTRSRYARSRSRVATGLLVTAPGVPMLFMGQEFLEDKLWSDNPNREDRMIWWDGLDADQHMSDFHRFTRDVLWLRRRHPALRAEPISVYPVDHHNRVFAFHRWVPGIGRDIVTVTSLNESTLHDYVLGFPRTGLWHEILNSDYHDNFPNPNVQGNFGAIDAGGEGRHGMPHSAAITIPANSILLFAIDHGD